MSGVPRPPRPVPRPAGRPVPRPKMPPPAAKNSAPPAAAAAAGPPRPPPVAKNGAAPARPAAPPPASGPAEWYHPKASESVIVAPRQDKNPVVGLIRGRVPVEMGNIVPDFLVGKANAVLFIGLRYHRLHPEYLGGRVKQLRDSHKYRLITILCNVDLDDPAGPLEGITTIAYHNQCSMLCAWGNEECAKYLVTLKSYENKPADLLQGRFETDHAVRLTEVLTTIPTVNKTDANTLMGQFGSLKDIMAADGKDLSQCPGIGDKKQRQLMKALHEPFFSADNGKDE